LGYTKQSWKNKVKRLGRWA